MQLRVACRRIDLSPHIIRHMNAHSENCAHAHTPRVQIYAINLLWLTHIVSMKKKEQQHEKIIIILQCEQNFIMVPAIWNKTVTGRQCLCRLASHEKMARKSIFAC